MGGLSDYQRRIVEAAIELSDGNHWYEAVREGKDLLLYPIGKIPGRGETKFRHIRVAADKLIGGDDCFTSELERKAQEIRRDDALGGESAQNKN